jgi:hypothetical protein
VKSSSNQSGTQIAPSKRAANESRHLRPLLV